MIVVTFYSFKGGVGRSMALANVAELLAKKGRRVVVCDFDLEAPGIERFAVDNDHVAREMHSWPGVVDLLTEYKQAVVHFNPPTPQAEAPSIERSAADDDVVAFDRHSPSDVVDLLTEHKQAIAHINPRTPEAVAPGIKRFAADNDDIALDRHGWSGVVDLLTEHKQAIAHVNPRMPEATEPEAAEFASIGDGLRLRRPSAFAKLVREYEGGGELRVLTAGRRDGEYQDKYASAVQSFDWNDFYEKWEGAAYLNFFRRDLESSGADVLLVDSRTGVTEQSGVCTHDLADVVVLFCAASDQSLRGTQWMVDTLSRGDLIAARGGRPLDLLVVAARVDQRAEVTHLGEFRERFAQRFGHHAERWGLGSVSSETREIPYVAHYAFRERVVARDHEIAQRGAEGMLQAYRLLSECLDLRIRGQLVLQQTAPSLLEPERKQTAAAAVDLVSLKSLLNLAEKRARTLASELAAAHERAADVTNLKSLLHSAESRATTLSSELAAARKQAAVAAMANEEALQQARSASHRPASQLRVAVTVAILSVAAFVYQLVQSATLTSTLKAQLESATRGLSDQALRAEAEAQEATAAAKRARLASERAAEREKKLFKAAQDASDEDRKVAASRADDARSQAVQARIEASAASQAKLNAETAARTARDAALVAQAAAGEASADRDIAREALESERAARAQVEAQVLDQTSLVRTVQEALAACESRLAVCAQPVLDQVLATTTTGGIE